MSQIKFGWLDYSSEHRNKVMAVLHALSSPGAVDELGIGQIRDGFANLLFPGTSTIQTRAKYFFIVPYLLMELEQEKIVSPKEFLQKLESRELDLIEPLKRNGGTRVIGENAGRNLKRKPSSIYWTGLRTFGFFRFPDPTLDEYARTICAMNRELKSGQPLGRHRDERQSQDDLDALQNHVPGGFWRCPNPKTTDWKENVSIELTPEEAAYLKDRILKSPKSQNSLLGFLVNQPPKLVGSVDHFDALGEIFQLPESIWPVYERAKRFSDYIYGATLRYNIVLSGGQNQRAVGLWEQWCDSDFVKQSFPKYQPSEAVESLGINNPRLYRFLVSWKEAYLSRKVDEMDKLIVAREIEIKSRDRAKLRNPSQYVYRNGDGMRGGKLEFRYTDAKAILMDIFHPLEESSNA